MTLAFGLHSPFFFPSPQRFESKCCLLFDYCSNIFLEMYIFCSVEIELDNIMDLNPSVVKSMVIYDPP